MARFRMATKDEMGQALGLPAGCVSPLAARAVPVFLDAALRQYETLLVGGGRPGVEVEITPHDLARVCNGEWLAFSC
jgi:Cys-tRNA(Pro)/Cys-tRNA(Cys) deacylase